jgi:ribosomal-protein-alanine N-acetyltransferase
MVSQMDELTAGLYTDRLKFVPVTPVDCNETYLSWLTDVETNQFLESSFSQYTLDALVNFVKEQQKSKKSIFFAIRLRENDKHIGNIKIDKIHPFHKTGEYGILMGDKSEWGKGYAKEASIAIVNYGFDELGLRKICLGVIIENIVAFNLYVKLGFIIEGLLRKNFFHTSTGNFYDEIRMAVFKEEWKFPKK